MEHGQTYNYFILLVLSLLVLLKFNSGELQPWDEALYACRAESITTSGNYIDQTNESLGGLYSSTSPPLTVWAIYLNMRIFGNNLFAIRLFSVICSIVSLILIYNIAKFVTDRKAIIAPILLASSILWNYYSRQAMTEIPLNMLFLLNLLLLIRYHLQADKSKSTIYLIAIALSFAGGMLTKITISLFPLAFALMFAIKYHKWKQLLLAYSCGFLLGSLWYINMGLLHGSEFWNALFLPQITTAIEGNSRLGGIGYYINILLISQPLTILLPFSIFRRSHTFNSKVFLIWFALMFAVLGISVTKNPHYVTYLLPSSILLIVCYFNKINIKRDFIFILFAIFWSFSEEFRHGLRGLIYLQFTNLWLIFALIAIICYIFRNVILSHKREVCIIIFAVLGGRIMFTNLIIPAGNTFGAKALVEKMVSLDADNAIYVYHRYNDGDSLRPQLKYYLAHSRYKFSISNLAIHKNIYQLKALKSLENNPDKYVIYLIPDRNILTIDATIEEIARRRTVLFRTYSYILFSKIIMPQQHYFIL